MLVVFAVILAGIVTGRLFADRRLAFVSPLITRIIWALLFLLGVEVGSDPAVAGGMATLGAAACTICAFSTAGSIGAAWLLWRHIRRRAGMGGPCAPVPAGASGEAGGSGVIESGTAGGEIIGCETVGCATAGCGSSGDLFSDGGPASGGGGVEPSFCGGAVPPAAKHPDDRTDPAVRIRSADPAAGERPAAFGRPNASGISIASSVSDADKVSSPVGGGGSSAAPEGGGPASERDSLWHSLRGSLVIVAFFAAGCVVGLQMPSSVAGSQAGVWVLYALMFCVGVSLGHDRTLAERIRRLDLRLALLPAATAAGTLAGAALAAPLVAPWSAGETLAVGAGFGYYSLSSIFIADLVGPELATVAFLCNVMREIFTLLCAPLVARWAGPLAAVSIGGATSFDTTLPVITRAAGKPYAVVAVFHGCVLDFSVPFLVTLFCRL